MASRRTRKTIKSNVTFGGLAAENDHLLSMAYFDNGDYEAIASREDRRCFVIGRTGSRKSAPFKHLLEQYPDRVITVIPENLSLPYFTNLNVIHHLLDLDVRLEPFLKALWKHVIVVEVLRHHYRITSPEVKGSILTQLRERFSRGPAKLMAIDYLNEFGDKFWCETDKRVKQVVESFAEKNHSVRWC